MRKLSLTAMLAGILAIGLAAAGCGDEDPPTTTSAGSELSADAEDGSEEEILIETDLHIPTGDVLARSTIGDSPFCPGGSFRDKHGNQQIGLVDRDMECPDGSLRIGFTPGPPTGPGGRVQSGLWTIVSGTGAYEGWRGHGEMETRYDPGTRALEGHETFTGTVVP